MSPLELLGAGVLLAWGSLPLLALTTRAEADPASRHRQLLVTLGLAACLIALPFLRGLVPAHLSASGAVLAAVSRAAVLVADRDDGPGLLAVVALAWLALCALAGLGTLWRVLRLRGVLRRSSLASEADTILALQVARSLSVAPTLVLLSEEASVPFVASVLRPCVVLPAGIRAHLDEAQLTCVFEHELSHLHRNDQLWAIAASLLRIPFAFHPTARTLVERAALAREQAVDAIASRRDAHAYSHTLLRVAELATPALECSEAVFMSARALSRRITMLTQSPRPSRAASLWPLLALVALIGAGAIAAPSGEEDVVSPDGGASSGVTTLTLSRKMQKVLVIKNLQRIAIGDPDVADIKTIGSHQLLITGRETGKTTLLVWVAGGERLTYLVDVK